MNIFAIYADDIKANVELLDDKRLVKMVLETAQLLATAIHHVGGTATYKSTHVNHPCSIWTRRSQANYGWLLSYFVAINDEYTYRFNKNHKCLGYLPEFTVAVNLFPIASQIDLHENCTPLKELPVYEAYRLTMIDKWRNDKRLPKWTNRNPPEWFINA